MSGPRQVMPARVRDFRGKQTLRGGRMGAWATYRTPGKGGGNSGYEGNAAILIAQQPVYIAWITVYLASGAGGNRFVQIFDANDAATHIVNGSAWNPDFIFQIQPGQTLSIVPPKERASFNWDPGPGGVLREDDGGYPMDRGIVLGVSTIDTDFTAVPANEFRVTSLRYLTPGIANV